MVVARTEVAEKPGCVCYAWMWVWVSGWLFLVRLWASIIEGEAFGCAALVRSPLDKAPATRADTTAKQEVP